MAISGRKLSSSSAKALPVPNSKAGSILAMGMSPRKLREQDRVNESSGDIERREWSDKTV